MSVYTTLGALKSFLKTKSRANVSSTIFDLHRLTATLLLACSILTTSRQYFGDPIHCAVTGAGKLSLAVFQSYCFMTGTYTLKPNSSEPTIEEAYPGIRPGSGSTDPRNLYHTYYQWVCVLLVIQAAAAYLPYHVWKSVEGGKVSKLMKKVSNDLLTETPLTDQVSGLADFISRHPGWFNPCSFKLLLCQVACLVSTVSQMYLMDLVLANQFLQLGSNLFYLSDLQATLAVVFPKVVKCSMNTYGPSGDIVHQHGLCTLPINILNEKIYLVLWVWMLFLVIVTSVILAYAFLLLLYPSLRVSQLRSSCPSLSPRLGRHLTRRASYGDMVLLQLIADNCDTAQFTTLINMLVEGEEDAYLTEPETTKYDCDLKMPDLKRNV